MGSFIRKWHKAKPGTSSSKVFLTEDQVRVIVAQQLKGKFANHFTLRVADNRYYCPSVRDAKEIIKNSRVDRNTWIEEKFDCDDFAHVLKSHFSEAAYVDGRRREAHCFGIVWGLLPIPHAINWMINDDLKIRFIEPQDDRIYRPRTIDREIGLMLI